MSLTLVASAENFNAEFDENNLTGDIGDTLTFTVTVTNTGTKILSFVNLTSSILEDGSGYSLSAPTVDNIVDLETSPSQDVSFNVMIPSTAFAGLYKGTLTVDDGVESQDLSYSVEVSSVTSFSTSSSALSVELFSGDQASTTFTITNDGSEPLTDVSISYTSEDGDAGKFEDNDNDEGTITFSSSATLNPGSSMTVTVTVDTDDEVDTGSYDGTVTVAATGAPSKTLSLAVEVTPQICEEGKQGDNFVIDIKEPEDNDEYLPGDTISLEVSVENMANENLDVVVEATLYNVKEGKKEVTAKVDGKIDEDETETFQFDLELPTDLDDADNYELYIQVHEDGNEDDSCDFESISLDISRDDTDAQITDITVSPQTDLMCNSAYTISMTVESLGKDEIRDAYVELLDGDLDVSMSSDQFTLGDHNDDDNSKNIDFALIVPEDLETGTYTLEAIVYDDNGDILDSELISVNVGECAPESASSLLDVTVADSYDVKGDELTLSMLIRNMGDSATTIQVGAEDVSWATLDGAEYINTLNPGDQTHAYLYFTLDPTTVGKHDMTLTVVDSDGNAVTKIVTLDFGEEETAEGDAFFSGISGWFTQKSKSTGSFWVIADVILVILSLVFLRLLFSKK